MSRTKKQKVKNVTLFVLDKSGSMGSIKTQAINGFNEYIQTLKNKGIDADFSLLLFDSESFDKPYWHKPISQVEPLSEKTYRPGSMTPLYDAVVSGVEELAEYVKGISGKVAVSVVVMTDGEENSSKEHDAACVRDLITSLEKEGHWTFVYLGANQDSWAVGQVLGISAGNTASWASTGKGTRSAFSNLANASAFYSMSIEDNAAKGVNLQVKDFFAKTGGDLNDAQS